MEFRPCIDIHDGKVKQIVGGSINDKVNEVKENFVSSEGAAFFANLYKSMNIRGGHVILLDKKGTKSYEATKKEAISAISNFKGGLQVGGGIDDICAAEFIDAGASHVIVTSYVFRDGIIDYDRLDRLVSLVGKEHLVLDLSCRKQDDRYYIVTDRWQKFTKVQLNEKVLESLEQYASEYLIHAVDVEGKQAGPDRELVKMLAGYDGIPITYAGGIHSFEDIDILKNEGKDKINITVGSALDLFGGNMPMAKVLELCNQS